MSTRTYQKLWLNYILPYVGWTLVRQRGYKLPPTADLTIFPEQNA